MTSEGKEEAKSVSTLEELPEDVWATLVPETIDPPLCENITEHGRSCRRSFKYKKSSKIIDCHDYCTSSEQCALWIFDLLENLPTGLTYTVPPFFTVDDYSSYNICAVTPARVKFTSSSVRKPLASLAEINRITIVVQQCFDDPEDPEGGISENVVTLEIDKIWKKRPMNDRGVGEWDNRWLFGHIGKVGEEYKWVNEYVPRDKNKGLAETLCKVLKVAPGKVMLVVYVFITSHSVRTTKQLEQTYEGPVSVQFELPKGETSWFSHPDNWYISNEEYRLLSFIRWK